MWGSTRRENRFFASLFPEKRLFLQTASGTAYLRLTPLRQLGLALAGITAAGWLALATAIVAVDRLGPTRAAGAEGAGAVHAERVAALEAERDGRAAEALSAQHRFRLALDRMGQQQTELLRETAEKRELASAVDVLRRRLGDAAAQRDRARAETEALRGQVAEAAETMEGQGAADLAATLRTVSAALSEAARVRDGATAERDALAADLAETETRLAVLTRRSEEMIAEIEYAVRTSFEPLEGLFRAVDLDLDHVLATVRRDHSGTGGPRSSVSMSSRSYAQDETNVRFDELLVDLDRMNMLRIAAGRIPYAMPVADNHRFTSGFGYRRDPKNGRRRMHAGIDLAAPRGTPIYATADGVVTAAGSESGYGKTVRIRHDFGFETVYAHHSAIRVRVGQQIARGEQIGDMGATGRATGVHLHYEVRLNGAPVNPMMYLEAARHVF